MDSPIRIRRALLSVSDKTDLVPFARALSELGVEIVSTGGTASVLAAAGVPVVPIDQLTGFPEILDGRVKTLHPAVHGGILHRRDDRSQLGEVERHRIPPIDLVCVNLYPFERTIRREGVSDAEAIEQIDIGGPAMLRSAAKNHASVAVVTAVNQYDRVISELKGHDGCTSARLREELAAAAFSRTAEYDATIAAWMGQRVIERFPAQLRLSYVAHAELRYGENPHQRAAVYRDPAADEPSVVTAEVLHGKALSYNNILDASAALELVHELRDLSPSLASACIVKHTNPCGAASAASVREAFERAYAGDPLAAYGGILAVSGELDGAAAESIAAGEKFLEVVVAETFSADAIRILGERWKSVRLLAVGAMRPVPTGSIALRSVPGGLLVQERDTHPCDPSGFRHAAGPPPSDSVRADAAFLMTVAKHLKSNAVCIGSARTLWGAGAGQMDRVASCRNAVEKARARLSSGEGGVVAASDAFFPFADGPTVLVDAGVRCLIHPGGSKRDHETFELCEARGVTCLLTGVRHFLH